MTAFIRSLAARTLVFAVICGGASTALSAQAAQAGAQVNTGVEDVRDQFYAVMKQYSPSLGRILALDPGLMTREDYLTPYPALSTFLKQHPEIVRNPSYYLSRFAPDTSYYYSDPRERAWNNSMEMIGVFLIFVGVTGTLAWLVRTAIDYRRWGRLAKVQAEAHTKLLDRFTGNDELLAYVQSSAGARFLKSSPIALDGNSKPMGAPLGRILWSMNAGLVLAAAGIGLNYVSHRIDPYRADPIFMFSTLALSIGIGFLVSAAASYMLSSRLGLLGNAAGTDED